MNFTNSATGSKIHQQQPGRRIPNVNMIMCDNLLLLKLFMNIKEKSSCLLFSDNPIQNSFCQVVFPDIRL